MLTKAYVEEIVDEYRVKVRIPIFNGLSSSPNATPTEQLSISPICAIPGGKYNYSVGDIVFVTFEDNDLGRPVILGQLYADIDNQGLASLTLDSLTVKQSATLPSDTSIGNVSAESIKNLQGIRLPVQQQIDSLSGGVLGVGQNNPYMNTIVQNFMEAHYVVLPSGNYIVDSFKKEDLTAWLNNDSDHYFYEFTNNTGTDTEETPIYNQSKLLYKITLGSEWSTALSNLPNETPIYVVFDKDENNNIASATLYVQQSESSSGQMRFDALEGTKVSVELVNIDAETEGQDLTKHGDKKFWDLLLTNFVSKYQVVPVGNLPSNPKSDVTYFTQGKIDSQSTIVRKEFNFPWTHYTQNTVVVFSPLYPVDEDDTVTLYYSDGTEDTDVVVQAGSETFGDFDYLFALCDNSKVVDGVSIGSGEDQERVLFSLSYTQGTQNSWSTPIVYQVKKSGDEKGQVELKDIVINMVSQTFQALSEKYTMSNVLQMVGVLSMQLCGVDVRQLYGELYSKKQTIDYSNYHGMSQQSIQGGFGTTLNAVDLLYLDMYGDSDNGVVYARDILAAQDGVTIYGYDAMPYSWKDVYIDQSSSDPVHALTRGSP